MSRSVNFPWVPIGWFTVLLIVLYFPVLREMVMEWAESEDMGHGFFVPVVAGYIVWNKREELARVAVRPCWWAVPLVVWGFLQAIVGFMGADYFISRTGFYLAMLGVVWSLVGTQMVRALGFPLFLMLFMIRIPLFIYSQITFPLQIFASTIAENIISLAGIPVLRTGNILELPSQRLSVVEACSGIRSLLSLSFLSLVYGYLFDRRAWMKWLLLVASVPTAILANAMRVTLTGFLSEVDPELARGAYHTFEGWVIFVVAGVTLALIHWTVSRVLASYARRRREATG